MTKQRLYPGRDRVMDYGRSFVFLLAGMTVVCLFSCATNRQDDETSVWPDGIECTWLGQDYWANRLQDWQFANGRLECIEGSADRPFRTVHYLTRRLGSHGGTLQMSVRTGRLDSGGDGLHDAMSGFLVGAGRDLDYRGAALVHHSVGPGGGFIALMEANGRAIITDFAREMDYMPASAGDVPASLPDEVYLHLTAEPGEDGYTVTMSVIDPANDTVLSSATSECVKPYRLEGNIALVSHPGESGGRFWFDDWEVVGSKVNVFPERSLGPVISTQYTVHDGVMKLTAQLMPVDINSIDEVSLYLDESSGFPDMTRDSEPAATADIIVPGYTATFRIGNWDDSKDVNYTVNVDGRLEAVPYTGVIRRDPVEKSEIVIAGFTGNHNLAHPGVERGVPWDESGVWFPHIDIIESVKKHNPDILFFSGDQVYESSSPTALVYEPINKLMLDYLYKWYLWCWAYADLTREIPSICIPDDHDVYQGNLWGAGGRKTDKDDKGGYVHPAEFVKMVERTQTSHLPDPYDSEPLGQGILSYYTDLTWGRIGIAVLEDRKFKSGCNGLVPPTSSSRADHVIDPDFDTKKADVPGAELLGQKQLQFIREWAADWRGADMKIAVSQTVFAGMATHHGPGLMRLYADYDSNGWPQSGRNRALSELRKGFAFMLAGDQHLATIVHHGIDDWNDAGWSFAVPSVANFYPRAWLPEKPGKNRKPGAPSFTGEFLDGLKNKVTVFAATNPAPQGREPEGLHDSMPGYGIVRFNKPARTITMECWPRYTSPGDPSTGGQYPGWPKTIDMEDNYGAKPIGYLPEISVEDVDRPVVSVINESTGEVVYTIRAKGRSYRPKVFKAGAYMVKAGDPDRGIWQTFEGLTVK